MPNRQAGTTVTRQMALMARMKLQSNMVVPGIELSSRKIGAQSGLNPAPENRSSGRLPLSYGPSPTEAVGMKSADLKHISEFLL